MEYKKTDKPRAHVTNAAKNELLRRLIGLLFSFCGPDEPSVYGLCRRYVDRFNGDNDDNTQTNGELALMRRTLPACRTVFDVGANVGDWASMALGINPSLSLHCFEPCRETFRILSSRFFGRNVVCNGFGLGSQPSEKALYLFDGQPGLSSFYRREGMEDGWAIQPSEKTEIVQVDTIDRYCTQRGIEEIDFVKLDVEGHELEVLRGASAMVSNGRIKIVQFEYGGCNVDARVFLKDFFDFFQKHDYTLWKILPQTLRRMDRYDQRMDSFQYQNWVVTRRDWVESHGHAFSQSLEHYQPR